MYIKCILLIGSIILYTGCREWQEPAMASDSLPEIFPDYSGVTVPANIAPLNFMVEDAEAVQAVFSVKGAEIAAIVGREGVVSVPFKKWAQILSFGKGEAVSVEVSVWNSEFPDGVRFRPFQINIAEDEIDPWIAYRLIEPGYMGWRQLGIYQREMSSFEESAIVTNRETNTTCLNCHNFPSYSSESMMFHARGANGGTILYNDGKLTKIDFKSIGPKKNTTYPAWHPEGRFIAFSSNTTHQIFLAEGNKPIEVFDSASDLVIYDIQTGEVLTDPRFITDDFMESFPAWSPDGRYLYFVSAEDVNLDLKFSPAAHYHLLRVPFDPETRTLGTQVDTLYNADSQGGSVSYPRISPDGRHLLYTWSEYGTFPIWHDEADMKMLDLQTMEEVDVILWNDPDHADSYHSWSSNGRWVMFGSRRLDGRYTRLYIAYLSEEGVPCKPFLLPQEDPRHNMWRLKSYNVPEFIDGKVALPEEAADLFYSEDK
ncbi:MAG: PD40 domain-containing protein [Bacteroidales bacterium]|nr:PD40 domain-containing protein [Bacteroidales bacterium]